ncbi:MAG: hypothetical protein AB198_01935 [Parcubacteria bacterium C7867-003]|nr:MAG: hypothetical protein AB198_01935 [Parcubacteria bacterium C7867-003]
MQENNPVIKPLQFDTYLALIENSIGSYLFKNLYLEIDGVKKDATEDGWLSCAFFVSSILYLCKYINDPHGTVSGTVKDLEKNGWVEIKEPVLGSVIVWKEGVNTNGHNHIGFYVGDGLAVSNDSWKKYPIKYDWKFEGKREVEKILWNPLIKK